MSIVSTKKKTNEKTNIYENHTWRKKERANLMFDYVL